MASTSTATLPTSDSIDPPPQRGGRTSLSSRNLAHISSSSHHLASSKLSLAERLSKSHLDFPLFKSRSSQSLERCLRSSPKSSRSGSNSSSEGRPPPVHTFEELLESVGGFGLYQRCLCFGLVGVSTFVCALTYYTQVLVLLSPPLRCGDVPLPGDSEGTSGAGSGPRFGSQQEVCGRNGSGVGGGDSVRVCTNWTYDTAQFFATVTSENNWVCEDHWRPFVIHAVFWVGNIVGSWLWGTVSDRVGRRPATLASFLVYAAGGALTLVYPADMLVLAAVRFLVGTAHHTISHLPYMLVIEHCSADARVYPLLALIGSWGVGGALLPWMAYAVWNWRALTLLSSLPLLVTILFYRYIPESCSWLMVQGRGEEAALVLRRIAHFNGRTLDEDAFTEVLVDMTSREPDKHDQSLLLVRRYPRLLRNMCLVIVLWMISCLCFYGHTQNTGNLGDSVLSSFSLGATTELLAMLVPFIINVYGRRRPMMLFFLTSGACGIAYALIGHMLSGGARLTLGLAGRMLIMGAYSTCLQYGPELFPTVVRGQSLALYELLGGVAIFISPSIVYLHQQRPGLPLLIIGCMSVLGAGIACLLPETAGQNLPQTLWDGDRLGEQQSMLPWRANMPATSGAGARSRRQQKRAEAEAGGGAATEL